MGILVLAQPLPARNPFPHGPNMEELPWRAGGALFFLRAEWEGLWEPAMQATLEDTADKGECLILNIVRSVVLSVQIDTYR